MTDTQLRQAITDISDDGNNTALEVRNILNDIVNRLPRAYDIRIRDVTNTYIQNNFTISGLGILEEEGWAICNGNNNTRNWGGRVPIAYDGAKYNNMGQPYGSEDAVLVAHYHEVKLGQKNGENSANVPYAAFCNSGSHDLGQEVSANSTTIGESGVGKNIQPSIVTLVTMKLP